MACGVGLCPGDLKDNANASATARIRRYVKVDAGEGMAGAAFARSTISNVTDARMDPDYVDAFDESAGYVTRSVLTLPFGPPGETPLGVLQFANRLWAPEYDDEDWGGDDDRKPEDAERYRQTGRINPRRFSGFEANEAAFTLDDFDMPEHVEALDVRDGDTGDGTRQINVVPRRRAEFLALRRTPRSRLRRRTRAALERNPRRYRSPRRTRPRWRASRT